MKKLFLISVFLLICSSFLFSQKINQMPVSGVFDKTGIIEAGINSQPLFPADGYGGYWSPLGSGMNYDVYIMNVYNGELIAGGSFTTAGGISAGYIAKWNGSVWSTLGTGMNNYVESLTLYNGNLIAGGYFTTAGGVSASHIAGWNGTSWSPLGSGTDNNVYSLTEYNGDLIAGGSFWVAGGTLIYRIAKWNGSSWSALGSGTNNAVLALTVYNGELIAGGNFTTAGGVPANYIAKWNGTSWSALGSGVNNSVHSLFVYNGELIAGGYFSIAGGVSAKCIAKWNGTSWSALGSGMNGYGSVRTLTTFNGELVAGGNFEDTGTDSANFIAVWNGTTWSGLGSELDEGVYDLKVYNGDLIAGGWFSVAGGDSANRIAKWSVLSSPALILPANGATGISLTPLLDWTEINETASYKIQISTNSGFTATVYDTSGVIPSQLNVPSGKLAGGTLYYWRVCGRNSSGDGPWSPVYVFITSVSLPSAPALVNPVNNSVNLPLNPAFHWNNIINADYYRIQISTDSGFTTSVVNDSTLTNPYYEIFLIGLLHNNTKYYWRVRAKNAAGWGAYSAVWNFTTALLNQPALQFPGNSSIGNTQPLNLQWNSSEGATSYRVQVASDSLFNSLVVNDSTVTGISKSVSGLNSLSWYYWRVRAKNNYGYSAYSNVWKFKTIGSPYYVLLYYPLNNSINIPTGITFKWYKTIEQTALKSNPPFINENIESPDAITNYWFELASDTSSVPVIRDSTLTDTTRTVSSLSNYTNYYWRVKAKGSNGWGAFSYWYKFRTVQNLPFSLKVYLEGFWNGSSQVQDTVRIYLAKDTAGYPLYDSLKVILSATGTIITTFKEADNGNYYIVIKHRNHLETWSRMSQNFTTDIAVVYDFTTDSSRAYGNNMKKAGSVWTLFGGDPNQDGSIDAVDIQTFIPQFGQTGSYLSCDFNGDGSVDAMDVVILSSNFGITKASPGYKMEHPVNTGIKEKPLQLKKSVSVLRRKE